ncbi:partner and localizer of BRCA2 isoform X2 [Fundulus heteroclitus]|uniref:partner and localizer of BRCA2 isoform X2 n=1 Tax=Fundulus heteroclitus TaxID=8078 RepID=UPI00165ACF5F|nr:partner and localizer of BRCA2 isoform X2 [Fundulus heteroclitus]
MEAGVGDFLPSEEQLRSTLLCDDKEELRRTLAQLQREYLKTAQRLKRAERLDAVRRHVKSRISLHKHQDHRDPEAPSSSSINPSPLVFNANNASVTGSPPSQAGAADRDASTRHPVIRFSLPGDPACPQTPDPSDAAARSHRPSPALRLRSRRSRLRWEKRNADALQSSGSGEQRDERTENTRAADEEQTTEEENVVNESEELFSESPSLLLTHGSAQEHREAGGEMGKEEHRAQEGREKDLEVDGKCGRAALTPEEEGLHVGEKHSVNIERGEDGQREESETVAREDGSHENAEPTARAAKQRPLVEAEAEKGQTAADEKAASVLDSCTLVEGLLFPAEYYVRTTRRMTLSQSQPDVRAVILSQLSAGRQRRGGRGRGGRGDSRQQDRHTQTDSSSPSTSVEPLQPSPAHTQDSRELFSADPGAPPSPPVSSVRPPRGRRRGRGRGRGRPQRPPPLKHGREQSAGGLQPPGAAGPPSVTRGPARPTAGDQENFYPIFQQSRPQQRTTGTSGWESLLLPSSSSPPPASLPSLPSLMRRLKTVDIQQDFHLPDDQFASLKLHKLRQVAVESGHEYFSTPSHSTRMRSNSLYSAVDPPTPFSLPLSLTPTISPCPNESEQTSEPRPAGDLSSKCVDEELRDLNAPETNADDPKDSTEAALVEQDLEEHETVTERGAALSSDDKPVDFDEPHVRQSVVERRVCREHDRGRDSDEPRAEQSASEKQTSSEELMTTEPQLEDRCITEKPSIDFCEGQTGDEAPVSCSASKVGYDSAAKPPVNNLKQQYSPERFEEPAETDFSTERMGENKASQFLFKSPLDSVGSLFTAPYLPSSAPASSPVLPSLGVTPNAARLTTSPPAPSLLMPPPQSPSTQDPDLCLGPSAASIPPSLPPSICSQIQDFSERPALSSQDDGVGPAAGPVVEEGVTAEKRLLRCTHTLEAPAGGSLVDACCLPGPPGGLRVAAAGKWAVCLWSWTPESDWSLKHTWTFSEPVINVFPVPDSDGLMFVSLGQLEIRELRMLSCCSLSQTLICEGIIQAAVGLYDSRVATSSVSATGSALQVFTLSHGSSSLSSQPRVPPGVCVSSLAPVDGLSDALIGTDEGARLFIWNLKTGHLLTRVLLEPGLSNTACLRGYSERGVLFVLLQHQFLSSLDQEEKEAKEKHQMPSEEEMKPALLSLAAVNPMNGKSVLAARLCPPKGWTGRLCEVDVSRSRVAGLSQNGCVCVWELEEGGASPTAEAPQDEDWQLARWGEGDTLVIGHQSGDVSLHRYSAWPSQN